MSLSKWGEHNQVQPVNIGTQNKTQKSAEHKLSLNKSVQPVRIQLQTANRSTKHQEEPPVNKHKLWTHFFKVLQVQTYDF